MRAVVAAVVAVTLALTPVGRPARAAVPCAERSAPSDVGAWQARFADPAGADAPEPSLTLGAEATPAETGADLDRLRAAGFCTVVLVPHLGPGFDAQDIRQGPPFGHFWSQIEAALDQAAARGMKVWFETFQLGDAETTALKDHPEHAGMSLAEGTRGSEYQVSEAGFDRLDAAATDALIAVFYGEFQRRFPQRFGSTLIGFWDDESRLGSTTVYSKTTLPWSDKLPARFLAAHGYRLDLDTPALLEHLFHGSSPEARKVRSDYWAVVTKMFGEDRFGRIRSWLASRGVRFLVQPLADEGQATNDSAEVGNDLYAEGSFFGYLRGAGVPGSDTLRQDDDQGGIGSLNYGIVLKQTSSAAHVLGEADAQHEPWGHDQPTLGQMRYYTDRLVARGITLIQPAFYVQRSATGPATEASLNDLYLGNVQWPYQSAWTTYASRLKAFVGNGQTQADVLLLYPITAVWAADPDATVSANRRISYVNIGTALVDSHRGWDAADEDAVLDPATTVSGGAFHIGGRAYSTVVLPATEAIDAATAQRLLDLVAAGGHVIGVDHLPTTAADGDDAAVHDLLEQIFGVDPNAAIPPGVHPNVHPSGGSGITVGAGLDTTTDLGRDTRAHYQPVWDALDRTSVPLATFAPEDLLNTSSLTAEVGTIYTNEGHTAHEVLAFDRLGRDAYFVTNYPDGHERSLTDAGITPLDEKPHDTVMRVPHQRGVPQIWDPQTGQAADAPAWWRTADGATEVELHLPAQGGLGVVMRDGHDECHVTRSGTGATSVHGTGSGVEVTALWPAAPRTEVVPVECDGTPTDVTLHSDVTLPEVAVSGPYRFTLTRFRPPGDAVTPAAAEVTTGVRGAGTWTQPDPSTGAPPIVGVSGTAVYETLSTPLASTGALVVPADYLRPDVRLELDLGTVRDISELALNGSPRGTRPWPNHVYDVTDGVHAGDNALRMTVTNSPANAATGFQASPLRPSGLLTDPVLRARVQVTGSDSVTTAAAVVPDHRVPVLLMASGLVTGAVLLVVSRRRTRAA
jgi:hypothetical protein